MLMVPFLTLMLSQRGVPDATAVKMAIATSMATIVFTSASSVRAHHRHGAVRWDIARRMAPGIVGGGLLAGAAAFTFLQAASGWRCCLPASSSSRRRSCCASRKRVASRRLPSAAVQAAVGGGIGFLSGLVGAGGAFLSVPFMSRCNVPIHNAVATSAALGFPIAVANTAGYVVAGGACRRRCPGRSATCTCRRCSSLPPPACCWRRSAHAPHMRCRCGKYNACSRCCCMRLPPTC